MPKFSDEYYKWLIAMFGEISNFLLYINYSMILVDRSTELDASFEYAEWITQMNLVKPI